MASDSNGMSAADASLSPDLIAQRGFLTARRGFDPDEVRKFLVQVAKEFRTLRQRETSLEEALRDAEHRASHPSWDENSLLSAVGEETVSILRSAHAAATDIRGKAEDNASRILKEAHEQAEALRSEAEEILSKRVGEADTAAARVRELANADAERMRDTARQQSEAVRTQAEAQRKAVVEAAQTTRERILSDLTRRRKVASVQIEQLRAGRERLLEAYRVVRRTLDEVTEELQRADAEARAAAEAAGRRQPGSDASSSAEEATTTGRDDTVLAEGPPVDDNDQEGSLAAGDHPDRGSDGPARLAKAPKAESTGEWAPSANGRPEGGDAAAELQGVRITGVLKEEIVPEDGATVETLFARIRADRQQAVPRGQDRVDEPEGEAPEDAAPEAFTALEPAPVSAEVPLSDADETALQRRDEAVGRIEANLARRLKRALQDEQNDLLDRLRNIGSQPTAAVVLPGRDTHAARFAKTGRSLLDQAARAGAGFTTAMIDDPDAKPGGDMPNLEDLTANLAGAIVDPLRRRLEQVFVEGYDDDPTVLAEALGAAYREWKTQRIELIAADHVASAFARGAFAATPEGTHLRWIVEDFEGPCPDCDDNALAGGLLRGQAFPTGQRHPPAHAGCRCLLVPTT